MIRTTDGSSRGSDTPTNLWADAFENTSLAGSKAVHVPNRPPSEVRYIGIDKNAFVAWSPARLCCNDYHRSQIEEACESADVSFVDNKNFKNIYVESEEYQTSDPSAIAQLASQLSERVSDTRDNLGRTVTIVISFPGHGCITAVKSETVWTPCYQQGKESEGLFNGDNAFMGAHVAAMLNKKDVKTAVEWGHVAASFAVEQVGLPRLQIVDRKEVWNKVPVKEHLDDDQVLQGMSKEALRVEEWLKG